MTITPVVILLLRKKQIIDRDIMSAWPADTDHP